MASPFPRKGETHPADANGLCADHGSECDADYLAFLTDY